MSSETRSVNPIGVMVVDDHDIVRMGLRVMIDHAPELRFVGEAANGHEAVSHYTALKPDIVLMDMIMPQMDGVEAIRMIRRVDETARIIVLSNYTEGLLVRSAFEAGAMSYLGKDVPHELLVRAIVDGFEGKPTLAPTAAQELIEALRNTENAEYKLTPSEVEVLRCIAQGLSNIEIAQKLVVSTSTVKKHVSSILTKLEVNNRAEASAWAVRHKLADL
ncbi:MAG: response regulator transcription factor [bacterium]|nr:response regulator transcription factor [bacterium]